MVFSTFARLCNHSHYQTLEYFHHPKKKPVHFSSHSPYLPFPSPRKPPVFCLCGFCLFLTFLLHSHDVLKLFGVCSQPPNQDKNCPKRMLGVPGTWKKIP